MFGSTKSNVKAAQVQLQLQAEAAREKRPAIGMPSIIGNGLVVVGSLSSSGEIQIDGEVQGNVRAKALMIGEDASIHGDIFAERANIRGHIKGNIQATAVALSSRARVEGNVNCRTLSVEHGARLEGNCRHTDDPLAPTENVAAPQNRAPQSGATQMVSPASRPPVSMNSPRPAATLAPVARADASVPSANA